MELSPQSYKLHLVYIGYVGTVSMYEEEQCGPLTNAVEDLDLYVLIAMRIASHVSRGYRQLQSTDANKRHDQGDSLYCRLCMPLINTICSIGQKKGIGLADRRHPSEGPSSRHRSPRCFFPCCGCSCSCQSCFQEQGSSTQDGTVSIHQQQ
jgi:hypothetical protein